MTQVTRFTPTIRLDNPRTMTQWQFHVAIFSTLVAGLLCASVSTGYSQKEGKTPMDALPGVLGLVVTVPGFILTSLYNREYVRFEAAKHVYQANAEGKEYTRAIDWEEVEEDDEEVDEYTRDESGWVKDADNFTPLEAFYRNRNIKVEEIDPIDGLTSIKHRLLVDPRYSVSQILGTEKDILVAGIDGVIRPEQGYVAVAVKKDDSEREFISFGGLPPCPNPDGCCVLLGYETYSREPVIADLSNPDTCSIKGGGTSGSGKSEAMIQMAASLATWYTPEQVQMVFIDPKKTAFNGFTDSPYLWRKVCTDLPEGRSLFAAIERERDARQSLFKDGGFKDVDDYNKTSGSKVPHLVVFIDEVAFFTYGSGDAVRASREVLIRLAQTVRSAGIHLIVFGQYLNDNTFPKEARMNLQLTVLFRLDDDDRNRSAKLMLGEDYPARKLLPKGNGIIQYPGKGLIEIQSAYVNDRSIFSSKPLVSVELTEWDSELPELEAELPNESPELLENKDSSFSELPELKLTGWNGDSELPSEYVKIVVDSIRTGQSKTSLLQNVFGAKNGDNKYYKALSQKYEEIKAGLESVSQFN